MPARALVATALAYACLASAFPGSSASAGGSTAEVDANARAAGNRRPDAVRVGIALFAHVWPAQVLKVRVDGAASHEVAGLVISGVKFHGALTRAAFEDEVIALVRGTFAASGVEEVDCWTTVPLPIGAHVVVSGDMAAPSTRTVFSVTVRRSEGDGFAARIKRGTDVFWDPAFAASLADAVRPGASGSGAQS